MGNGQQAFTPNRIFCVARNYHLHAQEMQASVPSEPTFFMKPQSSLVLSNQPIVYPELTTQLEYEAELVILVGQAGKPKTEQEALSFIQALSLGIDLTLRDKQAKLKEKGLPWEMAKAFDGSAPIGAFTSWHDQISLDKITFSCYVNNELRQQGISSDMVFSMPQLVLSIAKLWSLQPGDLIYTGTPAGVGPLLRGDTISLQSDLLGKFSWQVV